VEKDPKSDFFSIEDRLLLRNYWRSKSIC